MEIGFRAAQEEDFGFCRALYFAGREDVTPEQEASLRERWTAREVRVVVCDGADVGWLQARTEGGALFLVQVFLKAAFQGMGIGTEVLTRLMGEAKRAGVPMTLDVVRSNPARRLYERLGFVTTHEDDRKLYMRREPDQGRPN